MRRLERHQKNILERNLLLAFAALILVVIFIFTVGIKALLGSAAFISRLMNKGQTETQSIKKQNFIGSIDVVSIPSATNSAKISISGRVLNYDTVVIFLNDEKIKEIKVKDSFDETIDDLEEGINQIYFLAKSKKTKTSEKTPVYTVLLKITTPPLEILEPKDNAKTNEQEIKLKGKTDKDTFVEVNHQPVVVNALGDFETLVKLNEGENKIIITAADIAGNVESKTITVVYEKD